MHDAVQIIRSFTVGCNAEILHRKRIDAETELMPTEGLEGMLIYNYRLVSYSAAQIDSKRFAAGAKQRVVQGACSTPETRDDFLKKGVTLRYSYYDKDKKPIATIDVKPADCGF